VIIESDRVALIDMDGSICDLDKSIRDKMRELMSPSEVQPDDITYEAARVYDDSIPYLKARRDLVKRLPGFWRNLPVISEGFDVLDQIRAVGFALNILTKGPHNTTSAWSEKVEWCREHVPDAQVTITENKSLTYGRVLFDDWPAYIEGWLARRPRGFVVMLDSPDNQHFDHKNVFRYLRGLSGDRNLEQKTKLQKLLLRAYER
jgi:5'-nucleotidase